ncbi:MAG: replication-associated recombination protein A [Bacteroidota bacterium]|nr:replication-associated recombination protein A [Bacteroidota bacterium]
MEHIPRIPLAERLRPRNLDDFLGQNHLTGKNSPIRKCIESGSIPSMIFWGPPGVGKTTLAQLISKETERTFFTLSAINSGVKEIREIIQKVKSGGMFSDGNAILFIDEIHRFSKSQQDSLLGAVENGTITLIGATTENPSFEVISALLSRCQVFTLKSHSVDDLEKILLSAIQKDEYLKSLSINIKEKEALFKISSGDARKLLNSFEIIVNNLKEETKTITNEIVLKIIQQNIALYDKNGEFHYDIISAFIKSIRGSDPNGAVYWLAKMIEGGEDPKFIARRLIILASEDIGLANPTALIMANNCFSAVEKIGWPESRIILSQCAIYLSCCEKSNSSYVAINKAQESLSNNDQLSVPLHLRNAPTKLMKELNYGADYMYSHDHKDNAHVQEFLPNELKNTTFFTPSNNKREMMFKDYLNKLWKGKYDY